MIEFHEVAVCYEPQKRHPVRSLDDFSLRVERGEWVFLVGPSGAGKSSLLKLAFCDVRAQSGQVIVDGRDITHLPARDVPALRRKIGVVFQDFQLLTQKTAWENVAFAPRVIGVPQNVIVREVPRALETVGLAHRADALPHELSGGEQQRIAIARAIVNDPILLLTDEPTGNLDPQTAAEVGALLARINAERGTTILMATHDRNLVDSMKKRVVRIREGRLVSDENPGVYHPEDDVNEARAQASRVMRQPDPVGNEPEQGFEHSGHLRNDSAHVLNDSGHVLNDSGHVRDDSDHLRDESDHVLNESDPVRDDSDRVRSESNRAVPLRSPKLPPLDEELAKTLNNKAPLGSPENPIVRYE